MTATVYDEHAQLYLDFVDRVVAAEPSLFRLLLDVLERAIGARLAGARVCDVACGEGYVSRFIASRGAREVVGIDVSSVLVEEARRRADAPCLTYRVDDATALRSLDDGAVDVAVSQMAMMDIHDHVAAFRAVRRVLKPGGAFAFSMLHPCFEAPYRLPDEPQFLVDEGGSPTAVMVRRYASEGHWQSDGTGLRGHVGSYHRMLSTYINDLVSSGFSVERIDEPLAAGDGLASQVPRVLVISAVAV